MRLASGGALRRATTRVADRMRRAPGRVRRGGLTPGTWAALPAPNTRGIVEREAANLGSVLAALESVAIPHFLIPRPEPHNIHVGLAAQDAPTLLDRLARVDPEPLVSWQAASTWRTAAARAALPSLADRPAILWVHHEPRARSRADVQDAARAIALELWQPLPNGDYAAPIPNPYASVIRPRSSPVDTVARTGHPIPTLAVFATPDIAEVRFPVDAVYLWVDDSDPHWQRRRDAALPGLGLGPAPGSVEAARFRQHDELRYSLRSLSMFAPWIRHVYLVTDQQRPAWLDSDCSRLTMVDHTELMGSAGRLPTFNSHALAARLHHIDGLADHFLYLNDDVFFGRRTGAEMWFAGNGQPRFYNTSTKVEPRDVADLTPHAAARNHTLDTVRRLTGRERRRNLQHGPHALSRPLLMELESLLPDEFARTWQHQVRDRDDLVVEWLHDQYGYCTGRAVDSRGGRYQYFNIGMPEVAHELAGGLDPMPHSLCLNDGSGPNSPELRARITRDFLRAAFPTPSEFERESALES